MHQKLHKAQLLLFDCREASFLSFFSAIVEVARAELLACGISEVHFQSILHFPELHKEILRKDIVHRYIHRELQFQNQTQGGRLGGKKPQKYNNSNNNKKATKQERRKEGRKRKRNREKEKPAWEAFISLSSEESIE